MSEKQIMVIDDDPDVRSLLATILEEKGYQVLQAKSGSEALEILKREVPHLIITDLLLPGEHGLDLIQVVKSEYFIPVIILSGVYHHREVKKIINDNFVEAFFEKPVNMNKLLAKVNQLLNE